MRIRTFQLIATGLFLARLSTGQSIINTVAGTGTCCNSTDGRQATATWFTGMSAITLDRQGNLYIWEGASSRVRKVNTAGIVSTVAGNGTPGYTGDGGPGTSASLFASNHEGLAVDDAGNLYISDGQNQVIRKVNAAGIITTVAGNGSPGFSGDGGPATAAQLQYPAAIALDSAGNLYIADKDNNRVRKVNTAGIITTVAGNGNVAYSGDGVQATATTVHNPDGITIDSVGNLYIAEGSDSRIRKVNPAGIISTIAGQTKKTNGFSGDGGPATAATLAGPLGIIVDSAGNLYIADNSNGRIRKVDAAGIITTVAGSTGNASSPLGDGGPATSAYLGVPGDVALDSGGNLYLTSSSSGWRVRKVATAAALSVSPSSLSFSYTIGGALPQPLTVTVTGPSSSSFTAAASTTSGSNWLSVTSPSGSNPPTITVSVNPAGLPGGPYQGAITLTPSGGAAVTFSVTLTVTGAGAPTISSGSVYNALGYQTKLSPGVVFVVFGSAMGPASLVAGSGPNYPDALGGTSITFTPQSGGAAINARMVYALAGQVAGVLPSSISPGTYAMRVSYNGLTSAPQNVTVVARSFGIATANSAGTGTAQATIGNVNGGVSLTRLTTGSVAFSGLTWTLTPAHPGDTLVLWGTGGGADAANDIGGTSGDQTVAGNFSVIVSGRQITPAYAGASSGYPGLWQVNFTLPSDIVPDCFASVQVSAAGELSNTVAIPIAAAGQSACADPQLNSDALSRLDAGGTVALGGFTLSKLNATTSLVTNGSTNTTSLTQETAAGAIALYTASEYAATYAGLKIGACTITDRTASAVDRNPAQPESYLDAGARLPLSGPGIAAGAALGIASANPGPIYSLSLANGTIAGSARYTLTGSGGAGIGPFTASVTTPASFTVANWDSLTNIDRSRPLTINWTGGGLDQIYITGTTFASVGKDAANNNVNHTVFFTCQVPAAPGSYTIPTAVLSHLLPASLPGVTPSLGSAVFVVESMNVQPFNASLISGGPVAYTGFSAVVAYSRNLTVQ